MKKLLAIAIAVLALAGMAQAQNQTPLTYTTTSAAVSASATTFNVASNSGFAPANTITNPIAANPFHQYALIDHEVIEVYAATGSYSITVVRGAFGTGATTHKSGAAVLVGPAQAFKAAAYEGSCTAANQLYLPVVVADKGQNREFLQNCNDGVWVEQTLPGQEPPFITVCSVPVGSVAYGSFGNDTNLTDGGQWRVSIYVPYTIVATGVKELNGDADGTDKLISAVYRSDGGKLIANSALAGATSSGTDAFQTLAFTAPVVLTGPARYWVVLQANGATAEIRTVATATFVNVYGAKVTGTFGTLATTFTPPTSLTANEAPIACIY